MIELEKLEKYDQLMKNLSDEYLSIHTSNHFYDEDGMHIWHLTSQLEKTIFDDDYECENHIIASLNDGVIIPNECCFCEDRDYVGYQSAWELCDSLSGDLLTIYETLCDFEEGIKDEIADELGLDEIDQLESDIMYISDITYENEEALQKLLSYLFLIKEGSCAHYCQIAVTLLDYETENNIIHIFLENDWKMRKVSESIAVVYTKM